MAEEQRGISKSDLEKEQWYYEEAAAEWAPQLTVNEGRDRVDNDNRIEDNRTDQATRGKGLGWFGLILSIISLFMMPVVLSAAGIIIGFIAIRRGARSLGTWSIIVGAASLLISLFITPFVA